MYMNGAFSLSLIPIIAAVPLVWFLFSKRGPVSNSPSTSSSSSSSSEVAGASSASTSSSSLAAGASSASVSANPYQVFLSFCGRDTRKGFTDILYTCLVDASIRTFRDDNELRSGEVINDELLKSIKESKILIPILSENYAYSKWCLRELELMVECSKTMGQMIYPVFYEVDPSLVRRQMGSYGKAFRLHRKKVDPYTIQRWKEALRIVGSMHGIELKKDIGFGGELVSFIRDNVLLELRKNYRHVPEILVGMNKHTEKLMELLDVDSQDVRIVGIHGMGGLGKTTIAKVIYDQLCEDFEGHCFLDNVREISKHRNGILHLQNQLFSKIKRRVVSMFSDINEGRARMKEAVQRKKLLIVLDDVDDKFQVDMLMGDPSWFGAQSRVILTTRNKSVLDFNELTGQREGPCAVYRSYNPDLMDDHQSLQLFCKYAFKKDSPVEGYEILSKEVVSIAAGLPLALKVLGSAFFGFENKDYWEDKLRQLIATPDKKFLKQLKLSFAALMDEEKEIFLDIACLFEGKDTTYPKYMWEACGFQCTSGIDSLVSRSLITVGSDGVIMMHNLLRDFGRQIVRERSLNVRGKQSRLWHEVEAMQVLESCEGTSSVEGLCLDSNDPVVARYFHNLSGLRYLKMRVNDVYGDFKDLLPNLRWLQCICSGKFSIINLNMSNLIVLDLSSSKLTQDWEGWGQLKMAKELKVLDLSCCYNIRVLPNLSMFGCLEILKLRCCKSLCTLNGLQQLKSLKHLDMSFCYDLARLPNLSNLTNLVELNLCSCGKLIGIEGLEKLESLQVLDIRSCNSLETLPDILHLKNLKRFKACDCCKIIQMKGLHRFMP